MINPSLLSTLTHKSKLVPHEFPHSNSPDELHVKMICPDIQKFNELEYLLFAHTPEVLAYSKHLQPKPNEAVYCFTGVTMAEKLMQIAEETLTVGDVKFATYEDAVLYAKRLIDAQKLDHLLDRFVFYFSPLHPKENDTDYWFRQVSEILRSGARYVMINHRMIKI